MPSAAPGLRLTSVSHTLYRQNTGRRKVGKHNRGSHALFNHLSLSLCGGAWHCILGRSGVGKSSLLRLMAGLDIPQTGQISDDLGRALHAQVSYMSQDDGLLPWLSVVDNVQLGPRLRGESTVASRARALDLLSMVNLLPWADAQTDQLSGGMRQRVALARTLLEDRPIVLMDEPFSRLDAVTRDELQVLASQLLKGRTVVLVTHDPHEALRLGHTIHVLQRKAESGASGKAIRQPCTDIIELGVSLRSGQTGLVDEADTYVAHACVADSIEAEINVADANEADISAPDTNVTKAACLLATNLISTDSASNTATLAMTKLWALLKASDPDSHVS